MTLPRPGLVMIALWWGFALSWIAAALWSSRADKRMPMRREIWYRIMLVAGAVILFIPAHGYRGPLRLWSVTRDVAWVCVCSIGVGFAFSWWARVHLGILWSGRITKKSAHRVIDTGPYAIVRHPIYTGILLAVYATAAAKGTVLGLIGAALVTLALWMKARLEEDFLASELVDYQDYKRRVPMLLPLGPRSR
jgi:protein-S-isoprenylcysteine O-methyltransferase Ste14